jgi:hypothetical protein
LTFRHTSSDQSLGTDIAAQDHSAWASSLFMGKAQAKKPEQSGNRM